MENDGKYRAWQEMEDRERKYMNPISFWEGIWFPIGGLLGLAYPYLIIAVISFFLFKTFG